MHAASLYISLVYVLLAIRLQSALGGNNNELPRREENHLVESLLHRRQVSSLSTSTSTGTSATSSDSATVATTASSSSAAITTATTASSSSTTIANTASSTDYGLGYAFWFPTSVPASAISTTSAGTTSAGTTSTGTTSAGSTITTDIYDPQFSITNLYSVSTYLKIFRILPNYDYPQAATMFVSDEHVYYDLNFTSCIQECAQWNINDQWASNSYTGCSGVSYVQKACYIKISGLSALSSAAPTYSPGSMSAVLHLIGAPCISNNY